MLHQVQWSQIWRRHQNPHMLRRIQFWWAVLSRLWNFEKKKSGSRDFTTMRNTWLSPRSAIWEYWTSLIVCLVWIQYSYGMPHVIRIGKLFTYTFTHTHTHACIITLKVAPHSAHVSAGHNAFTAAVASFWSKWALPFIFTSSFVNSQFYLSEGQPVSNKRAAHYCRRLPVKIEDAFSTRGPCNEILWFSVTSMHSALSVPFSAASVLSHYIQAHCHALWKEVLYFKDSYIKSYSIKLRQVSNSVTL